MILKMHQHQELIATNQNLNGTPKSVTHAMSDSTPSL
jgi:hypothetical protein